MRKVLRISFYIIILAVVLTGCAKVSTEEQHTITAEQHFKQCLNTYIENTSIKLNLPKSYLTELLKDVNLNTAVQQRYSQQTEFHATLEHYLNIVITNQTKELGNQFIEQYLDRLIPAEVTYGVPSYIIVSFIGIETRYGVKKPTFNALEALATLAYCSHRQAFFTNELTALITLISKNYISPNTCSSWAGALGYPQFMPTTYLYYGVDSNKDNKIDLINDLDDVFYSVGNFLRNLGWNYYRDWGYEVNVSDNALKKYPFIDGTNTTERRPIFEWEVLGIKPKDGKSFTSISALARIIKITNVNQNHEIKYFLVTSNFDAILKWNKSEFFALAVGKLSDILRRNPAFKKSPQAYDTLETKHIPSVNQQNSKELSQQNLDNTQTKKPHRENKSAVRKKLVIKKTKNKIPSKPSNYKNKNSKQVYSQKIMQPELKH